MVETGHIGGRPQVQFSISGGERPPRETHPIFSIGFRLLSLNFPLDFSANAIASTRLEIAFSEHERAG
jgi:hypothetical protein